MKDLIENLMVLEVDGLVYKNPVVARIKKELENRVSKIDEEIAKTSIYNIDERNGMRKAKKIILGENN